MSSVNKNKTLRKQVADVRASMTMQSQDKADKHHRTLNKLEAKLSSTEETQEELLTSFRSRMSQYGVDVSDCPLPLI